MAIVQGNIQYDATYYLGTTVVHVVAPPPLTVAGKEKMLREFYYHAWNAWNLLSAQERLTINADYDAK